MLNATWYLVCDMRSKVAHDLIQLDNTWGTVTGMLGQSDDNLEHFYLWATNHQGISFMPIDRARSVGVTEDSITQAIATAQPAVLAWLRSMRDPLLRATDSIMSVDRWNALDVVAQAQVAAYRQALRDVTNAPDPLNVTWPPIPPALDSLRTFDLNSLPRPSVAFAQMLINPFPPLTLAQQRTNQCLRIKELRDKRKSGGVKVSVGGVPYWFHTDDASRAQYALMDGIAIRNSLPADYTLEAGWKTMSGDYVPFTVGTLHAVISAGFANETAVFNVAKNHSTNVMNSTAPETYDYSTGWPTMYSDTL
jgi:hypothetical protein